MFGACLPILTNNIQLAQKPNRINNRFMDTLAQTTLFLLHNDLFAVQLNIENGC